MKVDFISGVQGSVANASAHKCQNLFPVIDPKSQKPYALLGTPGLKEFCDTGHPEEVRGLLPVGIMLYAVVGNLVFRIDDAGTATQLTGRLTTQTGVVWMAQNPTQIMIVDGVNGYIVDLDAGSVTAVLDSDLPTPVGLTFQDGYFICPVAGSDAFYISELNDGTIWDALDYASAEAQPDNAVATISDHRELWQFGERSTEVFQNTGNADFPFERVPGAYIERGCMSGHTACKLDNSVFWLDDNGQVVKAAGYTPQIVSDRAVEYQISQLSYPEQSHAYAYVQEGHSFYVLVFHKDGQAFALHLESGQWHTRTSGIQDLRHRGNCYALFNHRRLVGDFENGKIFEYDFETFDDSRAIARARVVHPERKTIFHHRLEVEFEGGIGLVTGDHQDPQAVLKYSDNHGKKWSSELWRDLGKIGEYETRARWNKLGRSKDRIYEVILPGAFRKAIIGATLNPIGEGH